MTALNMKGPLRALVVGLIGLHPLWAGPQAPVGAQPKTTTTIPTGPTLTWQTSVLADGATGGPVGVGFAQRRVILAGADGGDARGDDTDAVVHAFAGADGASLWSRRFDSGQTDATTALITTGRNVYLVGNATSFDGGQFHSDSFIRALRSRNGSTRWERMTDLTPGAFGESLFDAAAADGVLVVGGAVESKMLVRAVRQGNGGTLWEDVTDAPSAISERVSRVFVHGDRVYAAGDRDTVLGRSAPYVVRAYDLSSGERLWESQFGQQVNTARGLAMADGALVVAGHYWDIGPGVNHMELWGLDPDTGEVLWSRRPAGRSPNSSSSTADVISAGEMPTIGGSNSRARTRPVLRSYEADGTAAWKTGDGGLRHAAVTALALQHDTVLIAGSAERRPVPGMNTWLRGVDAVTGAVLWDEVVSIGAGDSRATALVSDSTRIAVAANAEAARGGQRWVVRLYRTR